jgi:hypothetical protein
MDAQKGSKIQLVCSINFFFIKNELGVILYNTNAEYMILIRLKTLKLYNGMIIMVFVLGKKSSRAFTRDTNKIHVIQNLIFFKILCFEHRFKPEIPIQFL